MINLFVFDGDGHIEGIYSFFEHDNDADEIIAGLISELGEDRYLVLTDEEVVEIVTPYSDDWDARLYIEKDEQGEVSFNEARYLEDKETEIGEQVLP